MNVATATTSSIAAPSVNTATTDAETCQDTEKAADVEKQVKKKKKDKV